MRTRRPQTPPTASRASLGSSPNIPIIIRSDSEADDDAPKNPSRHRNPSQVEPPTLSTTRKGLARPQAALQLRAKASSNSFSRKRDFRASTSQLISPVLGQGRRRDGPPPSSSLPPTLSGLSTQEYIRASERAQKQRRLREHRNRYGDNGNELDKWAHDGHIDRELEPLPRWAVPLVALAIVLTVFITWVTFCAMFGQEPRTLFEKESSWSVSRVASLDIILVKLIPSKECDEFGVLNLQW
jgi:hypothetical protein